MHSRPWGDSSTIGYVYEVQDEKDANRVGVCWARGRLRPGDLLLCVEHSGDHFYDYYLLDERMTSGSGREKRLLARVVQDRIGAYTLGKPVYQVKARKLGGFDDVVTLLPLEQ